MHTLVSLNNDFQLITVEATKLYLFCLWLFFIKEIVCGMFFFFT